MALRTDLDEYFSWEDEEKKAYATAVLQPLAAPFQGRLKPVEDDELHVVGTAPGGRPFRVKVDFGSGWFKIELKIANHTGILSLQRDKDQASGAPAEEPDEWDQKDKREMKEFIAEHVFIEEYKTEFDAMKQLLGQLPANFRPEVAKFMNAVHASRLLVDAEALEVSYDDEYYKSRMDGLLNYSLQFCGWIASIFEAGSQAVQAKPHVYIGGQAVTGGNLQLVRCQFCGGMVQLDPAGRCPNCGAVNKTA